ncbi:MAG: 6-phosphogluconolactonase [Sphingomonadales bacterium]
MSEIEWKIFDGAPDLIDAVAADVANTIGQAIEQRGSALVAFPGGTTPGPMFKRLATADVDWPRVSILPTDERVVDDDSPYNNLAMIRGHFAQTGADFVPLVTAASEYRAAGQAADDRLAGVHWPLDLVWAGMGQDGHVCSVFPGPDTDTAIATPARALGVMPDPLPAAAPVARVTLSASAMQAARVFMIVITGTPKRTALERAVAEGASSALPVGRVIAGCSAPAQVYWRP